MELVYVQMVNIKILKSINSHHSTYSMLYLPKKFKLKAYIHVHLGWNGKHCTLEGCPSNCNGHGQCKANNVLEWECLCDSGWYGAGCNIYLEQDCSDRKDNDGGKPCLFYIEVEIIVDIEELVLRLCIFQYPNVRSLTQLFYKI